MHACPVRLYRTCLIGCLDHVHGALHRVGVEAPRHVAHAYPGAAAAAAAAASCLSRSEDGRPAAAAGFTFRLLDAEIAFTGGRGGDTVHMVQQGFRARATAARASCTNKNSPGAFERGVGGGQLGRMRTGMPQGRADQTASRKAL